MINKMLVYSCFSVLIFLEKVLNLFVHKVLRVDISLVLLVIRVSFHIFFSL